MIIKNDDVNIIPTLENHLKIMLIQRIAVKAITRALGTAFTLSVLPFVKASFDESENPLDPRQPKQVQVAQEKTKPNNIQTLNMPNVNVILSPEEQIKLLKETVQTSKNTSDYLRAIEKVDLVTVGKLVYESDSNVDYLSALATITERTKTANETPEVKKLKEKVEDALIKITTAKVDYEILISRRGESVKKNTVKLLAQAIGENLTDSFINKALTQERIDCIYYLYPELSLKAKFEVTSKLLKDASKALMNPSEDKDLSSLEDVRTYWILSRIALDKEQKTILEKNKNEFRDLIGAYIYCSLAAEDPKRDLNYGYLSYLSQYLSWFPTNNLPKGTFDKNWQPQLEKITGYIVKNFNKENTERAYKLDSIRVLNRLNVLELEGGNEKSESKIYPALLKIYKDGYGILDDQLSADLSNALLDVIYHEAVMNHNPPHSNRVIKLNTPESREKIVYLIPNKSLIQSLEKMLGDIFSNPRNDEKDVSYNNAYHLASQLAREPYCMPKAILSELEAQNKKIINSKTDQIEGLVETTLWKLRKDTWGKPLTQEGTIVKEQLVKAGMTNLKAIIKIGINKHIESEAFSKFEEKIISGCRTLEISEKEFNEIKATIRESKNKRVQSSLDDLKKVKVSTNIAPNTKEHIFDSSAIQANINAFKNLLKDNPALESKYFEIIDDRLKPGTEKTEMDPRTRGMLYQSLIVMLKGAKSSEVLDRFTNAIAIESSPITTKMLGEALLHEFVKECTGKTDLEKTYRRGLSFKDAENLMEGCLMLNKNFRSFKEINPRALMEKEEKQAEKQILNFLVKVIKLNNNRTAIEKFLESSVNVRDSNNKTIKINPCAERILKNTSSILGGFGNKILQDSENIFNGHQFYKDKMFIPGNLSQARRLLDKTLENIEKELELKIHYSPQSTHPVMASAIVQLSYDKKETLDKAVNKLNEKLFNGKNKFALYQVYEGRLLRDCFQAYLETKNYKDEKDFSVREANCNYLVIKLKSLLSKPGEEKEDVEGFQKVAEKLHADLVQLDGRFYTERVRIPLQNLRVSFIEDFIALAPSGKRIEYLSITVNRFGLRKHISDDTLNKILGD